MKLPVWVGFVVHGTGSWRAPLMALLFQAPLFLPSHTTLAAVSYTTLYCFNRQPLEPEAPLCLGNDGMLYGTSANGGTNMLGSIFRMDTNGTIELLWSFSGRADGARPYGGLVQASDGRFYGAANRGGTNESTWSSGGGTIFRFSLPEGVVPLRNFSHYDQCGVYPYGELTQYADGYLYGTTSSGGSNNNGTIFRVSTNGAFSTVWHFRGSSGGRSPMTGLVAGDDGDLYGVTFSGGSNNQGTLYRYSPTNAHSVVWHFSGGADGGLPGGRLLRVSNVLYGTAQSGGSNGYGCVYKLVNGNTFVPLASFTNGPSGSAPVAGLTLAPNGEIYGVAVSGGTNVFGSRYGAIYRLQTNGSVAPVWMFSNEADGSHPQVPLTVGSDGWLYGFTPHGGTGTVLHLGVVFKMNVAGAVKPLHSFSRGPEVARVHFQEPDGSFVVSYENSHVWRRASVARGGSDWQPADIFTMGSIPLGFDYNIKLIRKADGNIYGTSWGGGTNGMGEIIRSTPSGDKALSWSSPETLMPSALTDASNGWCYGTAAVGLPPNNIYGSVFRVGATGNPEVVWTFQSGTNGYGPNYGVAIGGDGQIYGTTTYGGSNGNGVVYRLTTAGVYTVIWRFTNGVDGANPMHIIRGPDGACYGMTSHGGTSRNGSIYRVDTNGVFSLFASFPGGAGGRAPNPYMLLASDGNIYGTTGDGGTNSNRGVFYRLGSDGAIIPLYSFDDRMKLTDFVEGSDGAFYGVSQYPQNEGSDYSLNIVRFDIGLASPPAGYAGWARKITNGLTNMTDSATGDGYPNLLKYATGSSPTNQDDLARTMLVASNHGVRFVFNRNATATDVTFYVEGGFSVSNGSAWAPVATNKHGNWGGSAVISESGTSSPFVVTVMDPETNFASRYLRLRLSHP